MSRKECAYCGAPATTRDHIPPVKLFPKPRSSDLITVPACESCNNGFSANDEYFVWAVSMHVRCGGRQSELLVEQRLTPPVSDRRRRTIEALRRTLRPVNVVTEGGVFLGQAVGFDADRSRLNAVIERCVRGLYFRQFKCRVPDGLTVRGFVDPSPDSLQQPAVHALLNNPRRTSGEGIFKYWFKRAEPVEPGQLTGAALCLMQFFAGLVALGLVMTPESLKLPTVKPNV